MKKLKLIMTAYALLGGISLASAQTDVTATYITNAGFETDGAKSESKDDGNITGWTFTGYNDKTVYGVSNGGDISWITGVSATEGSCFAAIRHRWESGDQRESNLTQTVTLPKGKYTLKVDYQAYRKDDSSPRFQFSVNANGGALATVSGVFLQKDNTTFNDAIDKELSLDFEAFTAENTIKFYVKAKQYIQVAIDNLRLYYNGNYTSELASAIASAQILYTRTNNDALHTAISNAQSVLSNADNTVAYQTTIDNEVAALREAISTAYSSVTLLEGENVTFLLENADFESGSAVTGGICTYDYDCTANNTLSSQMAAVEGWTIVANGNAKAAGVLEFGSETFLGGTNYKPTSVASENDESKALGIVAVWGATAQYKQDVTLPAGSYVIEVPVYNLVGGTTDISKNLIGFVEDGGTEHLATSKKYDVNTWKTETLSFSLAEETSGYISLGYQSANEGSGKMPHLLIDGVKITYTSPAAASKARYDAAKEAAEDALGDENYVNVTGSEKSALQTEINKDEPTTKDGYDEAAEALEGATATFIGAKANYDAFVAATQVEYTEDKEKYPYASHEKFEAIATAQSAEPASAEDAAAKTAAIIAAYRQYVESNALAESVSDAVNMTDQIGDPDFEGVAIDGKTAGAWTFDQDGGTVAIKDNESFTDGGDNSNYSYFDYYNGSNNNQNVHQVIENVAPGRYLLSATGRGHANFNGNLKLYVVNKGSVNIPAVGNSGGDFGRGWNDVSLEFELETASDITIGVQTTNGQAQWWSVTRFRLVQLEATPIADASDYSDLNSAINTAEGYVLGFDEGQYAPYNNVAALEALATAKAVDQEKVNVKSAINNLTETLNSATWTQNATDVDIVYNGMFATVADGANYPEGWKRTNSWGNMQSEIEGDFATAYYNQPGSLQYGNQGVYLMPLAANTTYKLTFSYRSHEDNSNSGMTVSVLNGEDGLAEAGFRGNGSKTNWITVSKGFVTGAAGNYVLTLANGGNTWITNVSIVKVASEEIEVTAAGYATYASDFALDFTGKDIKAYTAKVEEGKIVLTPIEKVAAGVPVVLYYEGGKTESIPLLTDDADDATDNQLVRGTGGAVATTDGDYTNYILNNVDGIGFYKANNKMVATNRAYLPVLTSEIPTTARLTIVFEDATGIASLVNSEEVKSEKVYNLNGQRVTTPKRGLYIVNGKKIIKN